jgi:hypothetical protein
MVTIVQSTFARQAGNLSNTSRFDGKGSDLGGSRMRIVCSQVPGGNLYRIYRADTQFVTELQRLIPFLNDCAGAVLIGGTDGDPDVVLTVGPLDGETDAAFQSRIGRPLSRIALAVGEGASDGAG